MKSKAKFASFLWILIILSTLIIAVSTVSYAASPAAGRKALTASVAIPTAPADSPRPEGATETISNADVSNTTEAAPLTDFVLPADVLYDNGPLVTHPGAGAGGADESRLQNVSLGMNTIGFGHQVENNIRIADDFTITNPNGWDIDNIIFYAYQTGSSTTSTFRAVNLQIWNGPPNAGGTVILGDPTTNVLTDSIWSNIYRVLETTIGDTHRPVMANTVAVNTHLGPGTYWLDWQADGSLNAGPWAPPITILGQTVTGNALQSVAGIWGIVDDSGTLAPQGFPFTILGIVSSGGGEADLSLSLTGPSKVVAGETFTYTLEVINTGPDTAFEGVVTDTLPAGIAFVSASAGCSANGSLITCELGNLVSGSMATVEIVVMARTPGIWSNTATVTAATADPNQNNNRDQVQTTILAR